MQGAVSSLMEVATEKKQDRSSLDIFTTFLHFILLLTGLPVALRMAEPGECMSNHSPSQVHNNTNVKALL